jgi:MinD-like ATPase involved in chromosome partitioning or flagellar assembly
VYHHPSGLDVLFSGRGVRDQHDLPTSDLDALIDTLGTLDYDLVCCDLPSEWKQRPIIVSLLARPEASPIVVCPPGRKERDGALAALAVLQQIPRDDGRSALDAALIIFIAGERGHVMDIRSVRTDVLRQFPHVTDLGTLPRDPALLSMAAERPTFCSVFDLAPRRPYCRAIDTAAARWRAAVGLPEPTPAPARPRFWHRWHAHRSPAPSGMAASAHPEDHV